MPEIIKGLLQKFMSYMTTERISILKNALIKALNSFKDILWNEIKDEVLKCVEEMKKDAKNFLQSEEGQKKEEAVIEAIMERIKLPFVLKPFKFLIKKIIKDKIESSLLSLI